MGTTLVVKSFFTAKETIKLLEKNIGRTMYNIQHRKILYYPPPRILEIKTKVNKWDLIKLKSFCTPKVIISKIKNPQNGRKYLQMKQLTKD